VPVVVTDDSSLTAQRNSDVRNFFRMALIFELFLGGVFCFGRNLASVLDWE